MRVCFDDSACACSLGAMVIDGLSKIAQAQSGGAQNAQRGHNSHPGQGHGTRDFQSGGGGGGDINLDDITIDIIDENELLGMTGGDGAHIRSRGYVSCADAVYSVLISLCHPPPNVHSEV